MYHSTPAPGAGRFRPPTSAAFPHPVIASAHTTPDWAVANVSALEARRHGGGDAKMFATPIPTRPTPLGSTGRHRKGPDV
jgi:hypothetical protein